MLGQYIQTLGMNRFLSLTNRELGFAIRNKVLNKQSDRNPYTHSHRRANPLELK